MRILAISLCLLCLAQNVAASFLGEDKYWRPRESMTFYLDNENGGEFDVAISVRDMNVYRQVERPVNAWVIAPDGKIVSRLLIPDDGILHGDPKYRDGNFDIGCDLRYRDYHRHHSPGGVPPGKERSPYLSRPEQLPVRKFQLKVPDAGKGIYRLALAAGWDHWLSVTVSKPMAAAIDPGIGSLYLHGNQLAESYLWIPADTIDIGIGISEEIQPFNWRASMDGLTVSPRTSFNYKIRQNMPGGRVVKIETSGKTTGASLHIAGVPFILCPDAATAQKLGSWRPPEMEALKQWQPPQEFEKAAKKLIAFTPYFTFTGQHLPKKLNSASGYSVLCSSWWPLNDINRLQITAKNWEKLPNDVRTSLALIWEQWAEAHLLMEQGLCTNQWSYDLAHLADLAEYTGIPRLNEVLRYNIRRFCQENSLGRNAPDFDNYALRSTVRYDWAADIGMIDNGIPAEVFGHDNEYVLESTANIARVWQLTRSPEIVEALKKYYVLKTHLTLSKSGEVPKNAHRDTCSPTDSNSRTRYYTHKSPINKIHDLIPYGKLWIGKEDAVQWPFLEKQPFVRNLNNRYFCINTGAFYVILYGGPPSPVSNSWTNEFSDGASMEYQGYSGMGYGGWNRSVKSGGLSALWVPGCGPVLLANNHNIMYSNALWGHVQEAFPGKHSANYDPFLVTDAYTDAEVSFSETERRFTRQGKIDWTPLHFKRDIKILDNTLTTVLTLTSESDFTFKKLYESIPIYTDDRELTADGKVIEIPASIVTPAMKPVHPGENPGMPHFKATSLTLLSPKKHGVEINLFQEYHIAMPQTLRYRKEAASMTGLSLELPKRWEKGQTRQVIYRLTIR